MNKLKSILFFLFCFSFSLIAQNADHVNRGGIGALNIGLGFGSPDDLNDDISNTFGQSTSISGTSFQIGAGGFLLFSKRLLVGVEGYGLFHSEEEVGEYSAKLTGGAGEVKLGLALLNNNKFLGYPYIGIGYGGNRLELKNNSIFDVFFGETTVPVSFEERLRVRYPILDIGVSLIKIPAPDTDGISIGLNLGYRTSLGKDTWEMDNGDDVVSTNEMGFSNIYIKLSIGGGGFFYKKKKENP